MNCKGNMRDCVALQTNLDGKNNKNKSHIWGVNHVTMGDCGVRMRRIEAKIQKMWKTKEDETPFQALFMQGRGNEEVVDGWLHTLGSLKILSFLDTSLFLCTFLQHL